MPAWFTPLVYLLCFAASAACAYLLLASYRQRRASLLLWSGICFLFLAANNLAVIFDLLLISSVDLSILRIALSLAAVGVLLFGLIWRQEERE